MNIMKVLRLIIYSINTFNFLIFKSELKHEYHLKMEKNSENKYEITNILHVNYRILRILLELNSIENLK